MAQSVGENGRKGDRRTLFRRWHTNCGGEWGAIKSTWLLGFEWGDDTLPVGEKCAKMKSMSLLLLNSGHNAHTASEDQKLASHSVPNSGDDARSVGENEGKYGQHSCWCSIEEMTCSLWVGKGGNEINVAVDSQCRRRRTLCGREWAAKKSTWLSVLNSGDDARSMSQKGQNEINMTVSAQFRRRHTLWGREWTENGSSSLLVISSGDDALPVGKMARAPYQLHDCGCSIQETTHDLWAKMRSTWRSVLNSGDNAHSIRENWRRWDQYGCWCSIEDDARTVGKNGHKWDQYDPNGAQFRR